jgi:glycosyltransferase involved in cell wall biosynthesis
MKRATFVVTKSEHLRERAIQTGINPDKVRTVRNGCNPAVFHLADRGAARLELALDGQADLVLFVGRLDSAKGIFELLDAFALLASRRPNLRLAYVGDGPGADHLRSKAIGLGLETRVLLAGACPSQKVPRWLAAANVLALPSYREGYPNVVIEALSCGRPVIATDVGGIPELVDGSSGILVAPRDSRALANAIQTAMERDWDEQLISEQFHRSWDEAAEELLRVCELSIHHRAEELQLPSKAATVMSR